MEITLATTSASLTQDYKPHDDRPQSWVGELVGTEVQETLRSTRRLDLRRTVGSDFSLISACLEGARHLGPEDFRQGVEETYDAILDAAEPRNLVRLWNFVPGILEPLGEMDQRYKVFNAARFNAYSRWYGSTGNLAQRIATASGIGTTNDAFTVHALATDHPAVPIENPRQVPSYHYSKKYGPSPPCFSRATRVACASTGTNLLLVGGTASIRGETTCHIDALGLQINETIKNLAAVVASSLGTYGGDDPLNVSCRSLLAHYRHVRVYCPQEVDLRIVADRVHSEFRNLLGIELVQSDLCREGLRVEIEGWADLPP